MPFRCELNWIINFVHELEEKVFFHLLKVLFIDLVFYRKFEPPNGPPFDWKLVMSGLGIADSQRGRTIEQV